MSIVWPKTKATKISHKVSEYRAPPPYLGSIPKNKTIFFTASLICREWFLMVQAGPISVVQLVQTSPNVFHGFVLEKFQQDNFFGTPPVPLLTK